METNSEGVPYVAIDPGKEEEFTIWNACPECGARVEMSFAELMRCSHDAERPRPRCPGCGRPAKIGRAKRYNKATGEWEEA